MELMQVPPQKSKLREKETQTPENAGGPQPEFNSPPVPIAELVDLPDFPRCALGKHLNIGGSTGVLVQIVNQSIKIKTPEGSIQSFNTVRLKRLHGRPLSQETLRQGITEVVPAKPALPEPTETPPAKPAPMPPVDFNREAKPISLFAARPDFPKCVYGELLDIGGYTGIVVEIVKRSLKVRSQDGATRSYNEEALRKLYGNRAAG